MVWINFCCFVGFIGENCEINIDECGLKFCVNDVDCIDGLNFYYCNCIGFGKYRYYYIFFYWMYYMC